MRFRFILTEVGKGLRRNAQMVISVVLVTFVSLLFVGSAGLLQSQIGKLKDDWYGKVEVSVFLCPTDSTAATCASGEASKSQISDLRSVMSNELGGEIQKVYFETKKQAYQEFTKRYPNGYYLGTPLTVNDMQASFRIKLKDPEHYNVVADVLTGRPGVESVVDQRKMFDSIFTALDRASLLAAGLAVVMLLAALLLIATTIQLSALNRRSETQIMRLVGASDLFIYMPFMLEGAIAAVIGAVLAIGTLWVGVRYLVSDWLRQSVQWVDYIGVSDVVRLAPLLIAVAFGLAVISSLLTVRRHTRV